VEHIISQSKVVQEKTKISKFKVKKGTQPPEVKFLEINAMTVLLEFSSEKGIKVLNYEIELMDFREWRNWKHYSSPVGKVACLRNLNPNTSYVLRVRVFLKDSVSKWSQTKSFRTTALLKIFEFPRTETYLSQAIKSRKYLKGVKF
jgi:hypothetical protein